MDASPLPPLAIAIPNYGRTFEVERLIACLETEIAAAGPAAEGITVTIASNPHPTDNPHEALLAHAERLPWLTVHRHLANVGGVGNAQWLAEHTPAAEYFWLIGDDDLLLPGALTTVLELLAEHEPSWLFAPYYGADRDGIAKWGTGASGVVGHHASSRELWLEHQEKLTFISSCIVRSGAARPAVSDDEPDNPYWGILYHFRAAAGGPCVTAPDFLVRAGTDIAWREDHTNIMTLGFVDLWDDGLDDWLTAEDWAASIDARFQDSDWGLALWQHVTVERLADAVTTFPHSASLRSYLWQIALDREWAEGLQALDGALREVGLDAVARKLVRQGEAQFGKGKHVKAAKSFLAATKAMPTSGQAWNDLAVVLHALGDEAAAWAAENAVIVAPDDVEARLNHASILLAAGEVEDACTALDWVAEREPGNPWLAELEASARPASGGRTVAVAG